MTLRPRIQSSSRTAVGAGLDTLLLQLGTPFAGPAGAVGRDAPEYRAAPPAAASNLAAAFLDVARARAGHPAVETKAGAVSYGWILRAADCVRQYLCARPDYVAGAPVALQLSNSPEYLAAYYGTLLADCVVAPLPAALEQPRREKIYELCRPIVLISRAEDFGGPENDPSLALLRLPENGGGAVSLPAPRRQGDDLAMLLFTSGSTGMPKGVMLSHRNLLANAGSILHELPIRADDRTLVVLPFCHAFGNSILQTHILSGATLLLNGVLTFPSAIVEALRDCARRAFPRFPKFTACC